MKDKRQELEARLRWLLNEKQRKASELEVITCLIVDTAEQLVQLPLNDQVKSAALAVKSEIGPKDPLLGQSIDVLGLEDNPQMVRGRNALNNAGILTLDDLTRQTDEELDAIWYVSPWFVAEVKNKLEKLGLSLRQPELSDEG